MFAKRGKLSLATRLTAGAALICWLSALAFCAAECFSGASGCCPGPSCEPATSQHHHADAAHQEHNASSHDAEANHHSPDTPVPRNHSFCDSLKSIAQNSSQVSPIKPSLPLAYVLACFCPLDTAAQTQSCSHFREATERK